MKLFALVSGALPGAGAKQSHGVGLAHAVVLPALQHSSAPSRAGLGFPICVTWRWTPLPCKARGELELPPSPYGKPGEFGESGGRCRESEQWVRENVCCTPESTVPTLLGFDLVLSEGPQPSDSTACSPVRPKLKDRRWHCPETPPLSLLVGQR